MTRYLTPFLFAATTASAEAPRVLTDIAPVGSLVAGVLGDTPDVLLPPGADAHHFALKPSDGVTLGEADLIVKVGPALTPWLADPVATLAPEARVLVLMDSAGWEPLEIASHESHQGHEDHADDSHDHDATHDHDAAHDHGPLDPHGWLDPGVAKAWSTAISRTLTEIDPANTATYEANLALSVAGLDTLADDIRATLATASRPVIWPHDAYGYFQRAFPVEALGSIAPNDAATPGPARLRDLQGLAQAQPVCILTDETVPMDLAEVVGEGADARYARVDPIGTEGQSYGDMMRSLAQTLAECAAP